MQASVGHVHPFSPTKEASCRNCRKNSSATSGASLKRRRLPAPGCPVSVSSDQLVFGEGERGPDEDLKLQFEAISRFDPEAKTIVREVTDSLILKQEAKRWAGSGRP
jgi:hypothetical protein